MDYAVIRAVLDLGFRLIDTTTGRPVTESFCQFFRNRERFNPEPRGEGIYVLINTGRENFDLTVKVKGFEPKTVSVNYQELEERLPFMDVHLIPAKVGVESYIDLEGELEDIMSIEAIWLDKPFANVSSYNEKYQYITLMATEADYVFDDTVYALLDEDGASYQYLYPRDERNKESYNLARPLERDFYPNSNIFRIVRGTVEGNRYLLRIRDVGSKLPYLIRYETSTEEKYFTVDMATHPDAKSLIV